MKFLTIIAAAAAFNISALTAPLEANNDLISLEGRAGTVTCRPKLDGKEKKFVVEESTARSQAQKGGFKKGKSGDPHAYGNGDKIIWGVYNCDKKNAEHWEYPIYWKGHNGEWQKDVKTDVQRYGPTPIRVVYVNTAGGIQYCGVMTHSVVHKDNRGSEFFEKCK